MSHHTRSSRGLTRFTPRPTPLVQRLKRLNENGLAEQGEEGMSQPGLKLRPNFIALHEFKKLVRNANLNSVHLPYFSPLQKATPMIYDREPKKLFFHNVGLKWAVLSHLGIDKSKPTSSDKNDDPQIFHFEESNLDGASLDNARCSLIFKKCTMNGINLSGLKNSFAGLLVSDCEATRANFSNARLRTIMSRSQSEFLKVNLKHAKFVSSIIEYANFDKCDLNGADFSKSKIKDETSFVGNTLKNAKFVSTLFEESYINECDLTGADFSNSKLILSCKMQENNLKNAKFVSSLIELAYFYKCDLNGADFSHSNIHSETSFVENTLQNAKFVRTLFEESLFEDCDLFGADFSNSTLESVYFIGNVKVNFQNAKFVGAVCDHIVFEACNLNGSDFSNAVFQDFCEFENCTFIGTKFQDAVFSEIRFINCDLMGVEFGNANLSKVIFEDCMNVPGTTEMNQPRVWEDKDYDTCDNEVWNKDDDEDEDPEDDDKMDIDQDFIYKQDPISFKRLRRGTGMVMVQKKNANGDLLPNPDCYNRKTMLDWYNTTQRTYKPFTNPKNRDTITEDFFAENGGFTTTRQLRVTQNRGGRRNKLTHKRKLHKKPKYIVKMN